MTYEELERIRINLITKREKIKGTILRIYIVAVIIFSFILIINRSSSSYSTKILPSLIFSVLASAFELGFVAVFAYVVACAIKTGNEQKAYRTAYKSYFVTAAFNKVFTDLSYAHDAEMPYTIPNSTGTLYMGDRYSSNDYTIAKYKNIPFSQADIHIEDKYEDSKGHTHYSTLFRGRYITFDFNKNFDKKLLVASKNFHTDKHDQSLKKIELESVNFNKSFDIYAQDGFEAYYLLDPAVMERIEKLSNLYGGNIFICFFENKIHIAINNNVDSFEPPSPKNPIDEAKEFQKVMNDIKVVTDIVDEIKLVRER